MTSILPKYVPARKSQLDYYRAVPLYFQNQSQDFLLYKPAGINLNEMRIKDGRYPDKLYLKRTDKIRGVREVQKAFNRQLKNDIQSKNVKNIKNTLVKIVQETFSEPVSGSIEGLSATVNILVGHITNDIEIIKSLFRVSNKDYTTALHSINVMALAIGYAHHENFLNEDKMKIGLSALLHDIGKTKINSEILQAPRELTEDEFKEMKAHPIYGFNILSKCKFSNNDIKIVAVQHHERMDRSGYPNKIADISRLAQIIGLIDCYEALTNDDRPYRESVAPFKALTLIKNDVIAGKYNRKIFEKFVYSLKGIANVPGTHMVLK